MVSGAKKTKRGSITVAFNPNDTIQNDLYRYLSQFASMSGELKRLAYNMMLIEKMDQHRALSTGGSPLFWHGQRIAEAQAQGDSPQPAVKAKVQAPAAQSVVVPKPAVEKKAVENSIEKHLPVSAQSQHVVEKGEVQEAPSISGRPIAGESPLKTLGGEVDIDDSGSFSLSVDPSRVGVRDEFDVDLVKM